MICVQPSRKYPDGRTGTAAGYQAHKRMGEAPCVECYEANLAKGRDAWLRLTPEQRDRRRSDNRDEAKRRRERNAGAVRSEKHSYIATNRKIIREAKNRPCTDCGVQYPYYVMQFDHVGDDKLFNIGAYGPTSKRSLLLDEIAKCEIVCANCHAERSYQRMQTRRAE